MSPHVVATTTKEVKSRDLTQRPHRLNDRADDASSAGVPFDAGVGACVLDDYVTRAQSIQYREFAWSSARYRLGTFSLLSLESRRNAVWHASAKPYGPDFQLLPMSSRALRGLLA